MIYDIFINREESLTVSDLSISPHLYLTK